MKKIFLVVALLAAVAIGAFIIIQGKDNYDPSKYYVKLSDGLKVGSEIDFKLPDQFDKPHELTENTKMVIMVFSKPTGHTVKGFLKKQPKGFLESKRTLFVADISPMPVVIRNTFALPDFKKSDYSVLLIYDKKLAAKLKDEKHIDKIAVVYLENKKIKEIKYISKEEELKEILK